LFCFNIRECLKIVSILFSLSIVQLQTSYAGDFTGVAPLPGSHQFKQDNHRSFNILKALLFENNRLYGRANRIWKSLPESNSQVSDHLFHTDSATYQEFSHPEIPKSNKSLLLISRYFSWQKEWQQALQLLNNHRGTVSTVEKKLEVIRLNILLGFYQQAEKLIDNLGSIKHREKMQADINKIWLYILSGEQNQAMSGIRKLEEQYLYLPVSIMFPSKYLGGMEEQKTVLQTSLSRYPSNRNIFERLVNLLVETGSWMDLHELVYSQQFFEPASLDWTLLAEIYFNTGQKKSLDSLMSSLVTRQRKQPEFFDLLARLAIKQKNWDSLLRISEIFQDEFPELMDGKLYQAIYFQETGKFGKSRALTKQAGL